MISRRALLVECFLFLPAVMAAQTPTLTINSASLTIDPQNSDRYSLRGTFDGLSFGDA